MTDIDQRPVFETENPATQERGKRYPGHTPPEAADIARRAADAQRSWRRVCDRISLRRSLMRGSEPAARCGAGASRSVLHGSR